MTHHLGCVMHWKRRLDLPLVIQWCQCHAHWCLLCFCNGTHLIGHCLCGAGESGAVSVNSSGCFQVKCAEASVVTAGCLGKGWIAGLFAHNVVRWIVGEHTSPTLRLTMLFCIQLDPCECLSWFVRHPQRSNSNHVSGPQPEPTLWSFLAEIV